MNSHKEHDLMQQDLKGLDFNSIIGEPGDPNSAWHELRLAELSGCDYIFLSRRLGRKLKYRETLQDFILEIYDLLDSGPDRTRFFIYSVNNMGREEFDALNFTWKQGNFRDFNISTIKNIEQKEFIRTIYDHSALLLGPAPADEL
jgi:hypothetical protein